MTLMPRMSACKLLTAAVQAAVYVPWCVCTEVASCRSSCPPEAASSASPPAAPWTVLRLLSALQKHKRDTKSKPLLPGLKANQEIHSRILVRNAHLSCTLHLHLCPFSLCCEYRPPCRRRLWPDTSTQNLWSQRTARGTLPHRVSSSGCYWGHLWSDRPQQATIWKGQIRFHGCGHGTLAAAWNCCVYRQRSVEPLPVTPPFDPQYVLNARFLSSFAVVAEPGALRHLYVQTLPVESSRTGFTAQQTAPWTITGSGISVLFVALNAGLPHRYGMMNIFLF